MHGMLLTADPRALRRGRGADRAGGRGGARRAATTLHVLSASRAVVWHYLLDGRFADGAGEDRLGASPSSSAVGQRASRRTSTWRRAGCATRVRFYSDDFEGALRGAQRDLRARRCSVPNRTVQSGAASVLSLVHFARGQLRRGAAVGGAQPDDRRGDRQHRRRRIAARRWCWRRASRSASAVELRRATPMRSNRASAKGGNALLSVHVLVETLLAARRGEAGREAGAHWPSSAPAAAARQLLAGLAARRGR